MKPVDLNWKPSHFRPAASQEEVTSLFRHQATSKGIALTCEVDKSLPELMIGDPTRLRQVIGNVLSNAVKFTNEGAVTISVTGSIKSSDRCTLKIIVNDDGINMSEDVQKRIFEKFVQGDSSTNRRFGGTGLGMTISQRIVAAMNGTIGVTSTPNTGSTFTITLDLPLVTNVAETTAFQARNSASVCNKHFLVAEDNLSTKPSCVI